jgi:hypothetical protein
MEQQFFDCFVLSELAFAFVPCVFLSGMAYLWEDEMGHNDHIDFELYEHIKERLDEGLFEEKSKEYGIALQVVHQGIASLSPKQKVVWDKGISPILETPVTDEQKMQKALREDWEP